MSLLKSLSARLGANSGLRIKELSDKASKLVAKTAAAVTLALVGAPANAVPAPAPIVPQATGANGANSASSEISQIRDEIRNMINSGTTPSTVKPGLQKALELLQTTPLSVASIDEANRLILEAKSRMTNVSSVDRKGPEILSKTPTKLDANTIPGVLGGANTMLGGTNVPVVLGPNATLNVSAHGSRDTKGGALTYTTGTGNDYFGAKISGTTDTKAPESYSIRVGSSDLLFSQKPLKTRAGEIFGALKMGDTRLAGSYGLTKKTGSILGDLGLPKSINSQTFAADLVYELPHARLGISGVHQSQPRVAGNMYRIVGSDLYNIRTVVPGKRTTEVQISGGYQTSETSVLSVSALVDKTRNTYGGLLPESLNIRRGMGITYSTELSDFGANAELRFKKYGGEKLGVVMNFAHNSGWFASFDNGSKQFTAGYNHNFGGKNHNPIRTNVGETIGVVSRNGLVSSYSPHAHTQLDPVSRADFVIGGPSGKVEIQVTKKGDDYTAAIPGVDTIDTITQITFSCGDITGSISPGLFQISDQRLIFPTGKRLDDFYSELKKAGVKTGDTCKLRFGGTINGVPTKNDLEINFQYGSIKITGVNETSNQEDSKPQISYALIVTETSINIAQFVLSDPDNPTGYKVSPTVEVRDSSGNIVDRNNLRPDTQYTVTVSILSKNKATNKYELVQKQEVVRTKAQSLDTTAPSLTSSTELEPSTVGETKKYILHFGEAIKTVSVGSLPTGIIVTPTPIGNDVELTISTHASFTAGRVSIPLTVTDQADNPRTYTLGMTLRPSPVDHTEVVTLPTPTITATSVSFTGGNVVDTDNPTGFSSAIDYIIQDANGNNVSASSLTPGTAYTWQMQYATYDGKTNTLTTKRTSKQSFTTPALPDTTAPSLLLGQTNVTANIGESVAKSLQYSENIASAEFVGTLPAGLTALVSKSGSTVSYSFATDKNFTSFGNNPLTLRVKDDRGNTTNTTVNLVVNDVAPICSESPLVSINDEGGATAARVVNTLTCSDALGRTLIYSLQILSQTGTSFTGPATMSIDNTGKIWINPIDASSAYHINYKWIVTPQGGIAQSSGTDGLDIVDNF